MPTKNCASMSSTLCLEKDRVAQAMCSAPASGGWVYAVRRSCRIGTPVCGTICATRSLIPNRPKDTQVCTPIFLIQCKKIQQRRWLQFVCSVAQCRQLSVQPLPSVSSFCRTLNILFLPENSTTGMQIQQQVARRFFRIRIISLVPILDPYRTA